MDAASEAAALVALLRHGKGDPVGYADAVDEAGSARAVLEREHGLLAPQLAEAAAAEIKRWHSAGITPLGFFDAAYPENLKAVHDRPPIIFVAGRLLAADEKAVAVIGSRTATRAGLATARSIAEHLVDHSYTVVSGLAAGIDTAAHEAAIAQSGRTIAVLGNGLNHVYPPGNEALQRRIASEHAAVSQFWPEQPPSRHSFPMRNAVMSGIALASVIVEASHTSGARIQARLALGHGRPVLLLDGLLTQEWARDLTRRPGIHVVASASEVVEVVERLSSTGALLG